MSDFRPSYQDYLQFGNFGGSEASGSPGTEAWWNSLNPEQQFQLIGGNLYIHQGDPRYQGLADATHTTSGSDMVAYGPQNTNFNGEFVSQNNVSRQGGATISSWDNHTPLAQYSRDNALMPFLLGALGMVAGGAAFGAFGGEGGAAVGDSMGAAAGQGFGTALGETGAGAAGTLGGAAAGNGGGAAGGGTGEINPGMLSNFPTPQVGSLDLSGLNSAMNGLGLGGNSFLSTLNTGRRVLGGVNTVTQMLGGGNNTRTRTMSGNNGDILSLLLGGGGGGGGGNLLSLLGGGGGGGLGSLLAMLALGRSGGLFGNGRGTPEGMMNAGQHAADLADPWGASGNRSHFAELLTPEYVRNLLNPNPQDIQNNPEYQFQLNQGTNAINVGDAAQGTLHSGNRLMELERYGQGLATNFEQRNFMNNQLRLNQMENLGGVNASNPAAGALAYMGAYENSTSMQNNGMNQLLSRLMGGGGGGGLGGILQLLGGGANGIGSLLGSLFGGGGLDPSGLGQEINWEQLLGMNNISNNLFPGGDGGGGLDIWDAIAGP